MRLERYVSQSIHRSRRVVRGLISEGRVTLNGAVITDSGQQVVQHSDDVRLDGKKLEGPGGYRLLMMNKPRGCITATRSAEHETVMDHLPAALWHPKLFPVGRLDKDTTGLLLFATDGGVNQMLLHPRRHVEKAYIVTLKEPLAEEADAQFAAGVALSDGSVCLPSTLERIDQFTVRVVVTEGRYHQVKRMIGHVGGHLTALHRERIGTLTLDPSLAPGQTRPLTEKEREQLFRHARARASTGKGRTASRQNASTPPRRGRRRTKR